MTGTFLVFEGGEGTGKTTVIQWLKGELEKKGKKVLVTREPGGTGLAEELRKLLLLENEETWCPLAEFFIFAASRAQHLEKTIRPALFEDKWVLCDRFADSSWVYQGFVRGVNRNLINQVHKEVLGTTQPDLTFIFDLDPQIGLKRSFKKLHEQKSDENKFENEGLAFHEMVRAGYQSLLKETDRPRHRVDASLTPQDVQVQVWELMEKRFF